MSSKFSTHSALFAVQKAPKTSAQTKSQTLLHAGFLKRTLAMLLALILACSGLIVFPAAAFADEPAEIVVISEATQDDGIEIDDTIESREDIRGASDAEAKDDEASDDEKIVPLASTIITDPTTKINYYVWGEYATVCGYAGSNTSLDIPEKLGGCFIDCIELPRGSLNLTSLTVSKCTALGYLDCADNKLTSLDVSKNKKLWYLKCSDNLLTTLNVSSNPDLSELYCDYNKLKTLNLGSLSNLEYLGCSSNELTMLDASKSTGLSRLACHSNKLTSLDVSKFRKLENLECSSNQISSINVSNSPALTSLSCSENQLTALNISNNPRLASIYCNSNKLSALDASKNPALRFLQCSTNQIKVLDIAKNSALEYLYCDANQISALNVANKPKLLSLSCGGNKLTELDVTRNAELSSLVCGSNKLAVLDVSKNVKLKWLRCQINELTVLDISKNVLLQHLSCEANYIVDISALVAWSKQPGHTDYYTELQHSFTAPTITGDAAITLTAGYAATTKAYGITGAPAPRVSLVGAPAGVTIAQNGTLTIPAGLKAGAYSFSIKAFVQAAPATKTVNLKVNQKPSITGGKSKVTLKKKYKKTTVTFKLKGFPAPKLTIKAPKSIAKKITISKTGKLTIKKGIKPGTYKVTITAKNSKGKATKKITIKVKK
ncbi:MAG: hypothetical protein FWG00_02365 [Coriobacteriia bacterium]|nr:hypothetical protein [Coriobacteriia bacterium]